jgi:hypothetical protein
LCAFHFTDATPFAGATTLLGSAAASGASTDPHTAPREANDHPLSSPICGWVVVNLFDDALAFYETDGTALGEIIADLAQPWRGAPGGQVTAPERFADPVLTCP